MRNLSDTINDLKNFIVENKMDPSTRKVIKEAIAILEDEMMLSEVI